MTQQSQQGLTLGKKKCNKYDLIPTFYFWLANPSVLLLTISHLFALLILIPWVGLENDKKLNLSMWKIFLHWMLSTFV